MKKKSATHTTKHKGTSKHTATAKHKAHEEHLAHEAHEAHLAHEGKVHAVAKPAKPKKPAKARSLAVGDALPVCSFEALAMSLRLAGQFVHDDEVAACGCLRARFRSARVWTRQRDHGGLAAYRFGCGIGIGDLPLLNA